VDVRGHLRVIRWLVVPMCAALLGLAVDGCTQGRPGASCFPARPTVTPAKVQAGAAVAAHSAGFTSCTGHLPEHTRYGIEVRAGDGGTRRVGTVAVDTDGAFSTIVTIPRGTPPGLAFLDFRNDPLFGSLCHAAVCALYSSLPFIVTRGPTPAA
jgi:hypothetical protein